MVVPGKADESELVKRLTDLDDDRRMPLSDKPLADPEQKLIRRWIDAGAPRGEPVAVAEKAQQPASEAARRAVARRRHPRRGEGPGRGQGAGAGRLGPGGPQGRAAAVGHRPRLPRRRPAAGRRRRTARSWSGTWSTAARPFTLADVPGPVHALAFSRDGKRLAVGAGLPARSGVVRVYAVPGGTLLHDFEGHGDVVFGLAFRPDGGQLASASFDQTVRLWDLVRGRAVGRLPRPFRLRLRRRLRPRRPHAPQRRARTARSSGSTSPTLKELRTYSDHDDDVLAVAVQPGGGQFVTAGNEPQLRWWTTDGEKPAKRIDGHSAARSTSSPSATTARRLISAGGDGSVRLWDGHTGSALKTLAGRDRLAIRRGPLRRRPRSPRPAAGTAWSASGTPSPASSAPRCCSRPAMTPPPSSGWPSPRAATFAPPRASRALARWRVGGKEVDAGARSRGV